MQFRPISLILAAVLVPITAQAQEASNHTPDLGGVMPRLGKWSEQFTNAGFSGPDGFAPAVYDFARGKDGEVVAAGYFHWFGKEKAGPVARLEGEEWVAVREEWPREVPGTGGFTAIAISDEGVTALSSHSGAFGELPGEIWLDDGDQVHVIGNFQGAVRSLEWFNGQLWAAGIFQLAEGGVSHLAVWDGTAWSPAPGGPADRAVYRLTISGDSLLLAGDFTTVGGIPARGVAEWNGAEWKAYDLAPDDGFRVFAVTRDENGDLYAGGALTGGILRWNGAGWERIDGGVYYREFDGVVTDMTPHRGELYVTGCFTHLKGPESDTSAEPAASVAKWTGGGWESLDDGSEPLAHAWFEWGVCGFEPNEFTIWDVAFQRLFSDGENVFLGGMMAGAGGVPSQSILSHDGSEWRGYGETREGITGATRQVMTGGPGEAVYVMSPAGRASRAGEARSEAGIYRYDGEWEALGGPFPEGLICNRMAADALGGVYVACHVQGELEPSSQATVLRLGQGEEWETLGELAVEGQIWDMRFDPDGRLWVAGGVRLGPEEGSGFLARWDGDQFTVIEGGFNSMVFRIAFPPPEARQGPDDVMAAGAFTQIGGESFARIARRQGESWEPLGTGVSSAVLALAWGADAVYVSTEAPPSGPPGEPAPERLVLGRWDGSHWMELAAPENGMPPPRENTVPQFHDLLALEGGYLIAAGSVQPETGGRNVFLYDGQELTPLLGGLHAMNVYSIALAGDGLWFAGEIAEAGSDDERIPSVGVARLEAGTPEPEEPPSE